MINEKVVNILIERNISISTMESCTAGHLINRVTDIQGASNITNGGFVTYSNEQKIKMGVPNEIIEKYGVYSPKCALSMALTSKKLTNSDIGIGITGTLSNVDPNNDDSKIGTVFYCIVITHKDGNETVYQSEIQVPVMERYLQKEYIVNIVLERLYSEIKD